MHIRAGDLPQQLGGESSLLSQCSGASGLASGPMDQYRGARSIRGHFGGTISFPSGGSNEIGAFVGRAAVMKVEIGCKGNYAASVKQKMP